MASRPVAQLAEQRSPKPQVGGSIPSWPAKAIEVLIFVQTWSQMLVEGRDAELVYYEGLF